MNKILRATLALASFALSVALYAGSADVYVDNGQSISLQIGGNNDGNITIVNLDTNQTVATISALCWSPYYSSNYSYYGDTYVDGAAFSTDGYSTGVVTGLPAGNYRVIATAGQMSDFTSFSMGNYAEISLSGTYLWMDFYISVY